MHPMITVWWGIIPVRAWTRTETATNVIAVRKTQNTDFPLTWSFLNLILSARFREMTSTPPPPSRPTPKPLTESQPDRPWANNMATAYRYLATAPQAERFMYSRPCGADALCGRFTTTQTADRQFCGGPLLPCYKHPRPDDTPPSQQLPRWPFPGVLSFREAAEGTRHSPAVCSAGAGPGLRGRTSRRRRQHAPRAGASWARAAPGRPAPSPRPPAPTASDGQGRTGH